MEIIKDIKRKKDTGFSIVHVFVSVVDREIKRQHHEKEVYLFLCSPDTVEKYIQHWKVVLYTEKLTRKIIQH